MLFIGLLILVHITWSSARQAGCDQRGPLCGNDGKTYATMCQLISARLEDTDLRVLHEGSCIGYFLSASSDPWQDEGDVYSGSKFHGKAAKLQKYLSANNGKIKANMTRGWPHLGPIVTQPKQVPIERKLKKKETIDLMLSLN